MMKVDYGTYSNTWLIVGPLGGAAVLGGLAFLPVPPWARAILGVLALLREALRALRPGGAFAFQDPFGMKAIYGDLDALWLHCGPVG